MNTALKIGLGVTVAAGIGVAVFLGSRKAAAASAAKTAFKVTDCRYIEMIDQDAAMQALIASAIAEYNGDDEMAAAFLDRVLPVLFPECPNIADATIKVPSIPEVPPEFRGKEIPLPALRLGMVVLGLTVGDLREGKMPKLGASQESLSKAGWYMGPTVGSLSAWLLRGMSEV